MRQFSLCLRTADEYWMDEEAEPVSCECGGSTSDFVVRFKCHTMADACE